MYHFYSVQHVSNKHRYMKTLENGSHDYSLDQALSFGMGHHFKSIFDHFTKQFDVNAGILHIHEEVLSNIKSPMFLIPHVDKRHISYVIFVPITGYIYVWIAVHCDKKNHP